MFHWNAAAFFYLTGLYILAIHGIRCASYSFYRQIAFFSTACSPSMPSDPLHYLPCTISPPPEKTACACFQSTTVAMFSPGSGHVIVESRPWLSSAPGQSSGRCSRTLRTRGCPSCESRRKGLKARPESGSLGGVGSRRGRREPEGRRGVSPDYATDWSAKTLRRSARRS